MTDDSNALDEIAAAADELIPQLAERLRRHGLGEIEVARGDLRLRVRATPQGPVADPSPRAERSGGTGVPRTPAAPAGASASAVGVGSPAVGFFVYADGLGPGQAVAKGDALGHVEMLGVRHDVRAPRGGTVRNLVAESGEAVEYGQVVVELDPAEAPS
jgi:acetyl-CoA carboxylase biotin carboxyl carrier protein